MKAPIPLLDVLKKREIEIAAKIALGATRKDIASELKLSCKTIEYYIINIYNKLGTNSVAELVHWAIATKLINLKYKAEIENHPVIKKIEPVQEIVGAWRSRKKVKGNKYAALGDVALATTEINSTLLKNS